MQLLTAADGNVAELAFAPDRPSVVDFVDASNEDRLPHLVPLRIGRMLVSPFAFFRGSAGLMAGDLIALR